MATAVVVDPATRRHYYPAATAEEVAGRVVVTGDDGSQVTEWEPGTWWALATYDVDPRPAEEEALRDPDPATADDDDDTTGQGT